MPKATCIVLVVFLGGALICSLAIERNNFVWYIVVIFVKPCFSTEIIVIILLGGQCFILFYHVYRYIYRIIHIFSISQSCLGELSRSLFNIFFLLSTFIVVIYFLILIAIFWPINWETALSYTHILVHLHDGPDYPTNSTYSVWLILLTCSSLNVISTRSCYIRLLKYPNYVKRNISSRAYLIYNAKFVAGMSNDWNEWFLIARSLFCGGWSTFPNMIKLIPRGRRLGLSKNHCVSNAGSER